MPTVVNEFALHDFGVGVCEMQGEESAVFLLGEVEFGVRHAKTLFGNRPASSGRWTDRGWRRGGQGRRRARVAIKLVEMK